MDYLENIKVSFLCFKKYKHINNSKQYSLFSETSFRYEP